MISLLLPLFGVTAGFVALYFFRSHRRAAVLGAGLVPPLLLAAYAFAKLGTYAWGAVLVTFVMWWACVIVGSVLAALVIRPR